jgi:hypothetical protein
MSKKVCHYCARESKNNFCCDDHKAKFIHCKETTQPVPLQITPKLLIWSKRYDEIPAIIEKYRAKQVDYTDGCSALVVPRDPSLKPKEKKVKVKHEDYVFG